MNLLMKWTLIFAALMMVINPSHAWRIGTQQQASVLVHTTHFLTPNNGPAKVHAQAYLGTSDQNGNCNYTAIYDIGTTLLQNADFVYIDGIKLKSLVGSNYQCMTIYYYYRQIVTETFTLINNGVNYQTSSPATSQVTIL